MSLTHINCNLFRGAGASNDSSSYVALNPSRAPGSLVLGVSIAARQSLSNQVACKLGLEHFIDGVLAYYDELPSSDSDGEEGAESNPIGLEVLESAFKKANSKVYVLPMRDRYLPTQKP